MVGDQTAAEATTAASSLTIPEVLAQGPALHAKVRVELSNGTVVVGRVTAMDPLTMNMKLDGLLSADVIREEHTKRIERHDAVAAEEDGKHNKSEREEEEKKGKAFAHQQRMTFPTTRRRELDCRPPPLRCLNSIVVRGSHIRYVDFLSEEDGRSGNGLDELITAVQSVSIGGAGHPTST